MKHLAGGVVQQRILVLEMGIERCPVNLGARRDVLHRDAIDGLLLHQIHEGGLQKLLCPFDARIDFFVLNRHFWPFVV